MKKIYIIFISFISSICFSQNVTLDELMKLRKKDLATIEEQLTLKGWSYMSGEEAGLEALGKATFAYNKGSYDDKAESFIHYYYSADLTVNRISIQIVRKDKYNTFLARIKALGCKLIDSNITSGSIKKVYQGATLTFMISVSTSTDDFDATSTIYHLSILENHDYVINFDTKIAEELRTLFDNASENTITEDVAPAQEEAKPNLNKEFFIGRWSDMNSVFTFLENGDFIVKKDYEPEIRTRWTFINNKLLVGLGTNKSFIRYFITDNNSAFFSYYTDLNSEEINAFKVGD